MTLDAKIWFELKEDAVPEFIYADLCVSPPWESSTFQSTTTDGGNYTFNFDDKYIESFKQYDISETISLSLYVFVVYIFSSSEILIDMKG